jgi:dephospho-CoA kinase
VVCVDGVRRKVEASMLKRKYGKDFVLIYVKVPANIRYRRLAKRGRVGDPRTYREFVEQDRSEERAFYISETIKLADYTISNEGSVRELGAKVEHLLERILKNNSGPNN